MSGHTEHPAETPQRVQLGPEAGRVAGIAMGVGVAGLVVCLGAASFTEHGVRRFLFAYLVSFCFFLSISLGCLFFVLLQHLTRAGWSVNVRRVAEVIAAALPVLGVLALPIIISVLTYSGSLYSWAVPESKIHHDELLMAKRAFLNPIFFVLRMVAYFAIWTWIARWYWRQSTAQDATGDVELTNKMQARSAPAMVAYAVTVTLAAFDLLMSLDPHWYSTIFGVYYFAGAAIACFASLVIAIRMLQRRGYLVRGVTVEHFHDLGKFLFGFVFFWGYIAFSQYMLLWYANIPEETAWLQRHGATTVSTDVNGYSFVAVALLFGQLLIPFAGLLSRHVKRNQKSLFFWAVWVMVFHWVDLYWIVMPQLDTKLRFGVVELAALVGIGGIFVATLLRLAAKHSLRPMADPRLAESLAFENV